jgi:pseudouridine synthase
MGLKYLTKNGINSVDFRGKTVLDVGSSTGGFTDYALQHGAAKVIAVDVGTDQLHPSLHGDKRIELHEKTDIRDFTTNQVVDIVVIDVSFISLREILPSVAHIAPKATVVAMVKPQFEAGKDQINKGIIKNDAVKIYIALNKPKGYIVSKSDTHGRKTVFSLLPEELRNKVWNVGRLDFDTEGLLLLTNDGELTQKLAHPRYEHDKEYEVITNVPAEEKQLDKLRTGVEIATGITHPAKVKTRSGNVFITIHEGKKRQVRRMFNGVGLEVKNLKRVRINKLTLPKDLPVGEYRMIQKSDIL